MTGARRLLLVDDDPEVAWSIGRCLTRAGFAVTTCGDGAEAIPLLGAHPFDILVTDVQMPRLNGLALVDWVRRHRPSVRVVVITAYGSTAVRRVAVSKGAIHYVEKPVDPAILIEVLSDVSATGATFAGSVEGIDLFDCVQMVLLTRGRHLLQVADEAGDVGLLWIDHGNILHATCADLEGLAAVRSCLAFSGGSFSTLPWREPDRISIDLPGNHLMMEAARLKDEHDRATGIQLPEERQPSAPWD